MKTEISKNISDEFPVETPTEILTETPIYYETEPPAVLPGFLPTVPPVPNAWVTQNGTPFENLEGALKGIPDEFPEETTNDTLTEPPIDYETEPPTSLLELLPTIPPFTGLQVTPNETPSEKSNVTLMQILKKLHVEPSRLLS